MSSTPQQSSHRSSGCTRATIFITIFFFVTMVFLASQNKSPTLVATPMRVVPIRELSSSRSSSYVDDSSVAVSSQEKSVRVNQSLLSNSMSSTLPPPLDDRKKSNKHLESDEDVAIATRLTTPGSGLPNVCNNSVKLMPKGSMPVIALASLPGSGNTWLRHLIESVTGIYTGSVYHDRRLIAGGFLGEECDPLSGRTVVVKMHGIGRPTKIKKAIFLVRNFYEATQAQFNLRNSHGHTKLVADSLYKTKEWPKCVSLMLDKWKKLVFNAATHFGRGDNLLVVHYQDLKEDLSKELTRIVDFLGLKLDEERLRCTIQNSEGNFHRPKHILSFDPFDGALRTRVQKAMIETQTKWKRYNLTLLRVS